LINFFGKIPLIRGRALLTYPILSRPVINPLNKGRINQWWWIENLTPPLFMVGWRECPAKNVFLKINKFGNILYKFVKKIKIKSIQGNQNINQ
jgi:hypothetical protein